MHLLLQLLLVIPAASAQADVRILAEIGTPAIGFPQDWVYWNVENPAMGRDGHVAFTGAGDTSVFSTANNTPAVWTGLPGAISLILQENDGISGLPGNVLFRAPFSTPIVTRSGHVGLLANLAGAVVFNQTDDALVAHVGGVTHLVLREGVQAPGFGPGVIVLPRSLPFSFTDAGMLVATSVSTGADAIWFWDFETTAPIVTSGDSAGPDLPGCTLNDLFQFAINDGGRIFFRASLSGIGCLGNVIFELVGGTPQVVVAHDDPVPGMADTGFEDPGNLSFQINDAGDVTFRSVLRRVGGAGAHSLWVARSGGATELLALEDESLQGAPNEILLDQFFVQAHSVDQAVTALKVFSTTTRSILVGPPRANPYAAFEDAGVSQLEVLASEGAQPPGFPATWFYESFDLGPPMIGGEGFVAWTATVADALDPIPTQTVGVWGDSPDSDSELLVAEGIPFQSGGEERTLSRIFYTPEVSSQSGLTAQISETGRVLLFADSTPGTRAIVLVPEPGGVGVLVALAALAALGLRRTEAAP